MTRKMIRDKVPLQEISPKKIEDFHAKGQNGFCNFGFTNASGTHRTSDEIIYCKTENSMTGYTTTIFKRHFSSI